MWLTRPVVSTRGMTRVYPNDAGRYTMNAEPQPANLGKIEHLECKKRTQGILQQALQQQPELSQLTHMVDFRHFRDVHTQSPVVLLLLQ